MSTCTATAYKTSAFRRPAFRASDSRKAQKLSGFRANGTYRTCIKDCVLLDLGCGTGLELDRIWAKNPGVDVTGVDLCESMLKKLLTKHVDKPFTAVCQDYFKYDFGTGKWDAVISFESLHHFLPERKKELYQRIYNGLKAGGIFILGDYIACCDEEEELLRSVYLKKRERFAIPDN